MKLARAPYYRWVRNPEGPAEQLRKQRVAALTAAHEDDVEFGYRLLADEARDAGFPMADRTAWRLCSKAGIMAAIIKTRKKRGKKPGPPVFDDHVMRNFTADAPNQLWLSDITEHRTAEGKLYLCAIKDVFSRRIVGYSISDRMQARLVVNALQNAIARRGDVAGCVVHSDRGSQGEFNWSSQHLDQEVFDGSSSAGRGQGGSSEAPLAGASEVPEAGRGGVLGADRERAARGGSRGCCRRGVRGRREMVPTRWRHGAVRHHPAAVGPLPLVR
ncbi:hypothetical protein BJ959_001776 [Chryseoglobus frigidaquae]|uniref:Integrase catalytic domain-containing protein n=1 Tax=Microcella frigidaquae TaxID=424758 RepID=A0A840XFK2_9MICO|nr:hypothetical protein [Microcella frigidaquae]MBB5618280.1 hypothetical protein [Microcella frigidaquae]